MLKGEQLGEAIRSAIKLKGVTQREVAMHFGVQPPSIHDWMKRGTISKEKLPELWRYFSDVVGPEHWGLDSNLPIEPSNVEPGPDRLRRSVRLPVVGEVKAGTEGYLEELQYPVGHGEGYVEYWTSDKHAYALRVRGDSMHPRYRAGEFIIVSPSIEAQPGSDVVICMNDGQKMLKTLSWVRDREVQLLSINNGYTPFTVERSEIHQIQRVAGSVPSDAFLLG